MFIRCLLNDHMRESSLLRLGSKQPLVSPPQLYPHVPRGGFLSTVFMCHLSSGKLKFLQVPVSSFTDLDNKGPGPELLPKGRMLP